MKNTSDADELKALITKYWTKKLWAVHSEMGLCAYGKFRADLLAMSIRRELVIIEVKSSVSDFRSDKKLSSYLRYCDRLYLAVSEKVWLKIKNEVPAGIGVFVVGHKAVIKKPAKKNNIDDEIRMNLITRMAYRSASHVRKERKNKHARHKLIADKLVMAIKAVPKEHRNSRNVAKTICDTLVQYV